MYPYPLLTSRLVQYRRGQEVKNLRRCHENSREEPRFARMRDMQACHCIDSLQLVQSEHYGQGTT